MKKSFLITASLLVLGPLAHVNTCNASSFTPEIDSPSVSMMRQDVEALATYAKTESAFVQTAREVLQAQAAGNDVSEDLMASFVDLGASIKGQIEDGIQGKLLEAEVEKHTVGKVKTSKVKGASKLDRVKEAFGISSKKEDLNVLSLDGGGMRGIGTLVMLSILEMKTGKKAYELFDRIYGTSTGGLMALLLAKGHSATKVLDIYFENIDRIFYRSWGDTFSNPLGLFAATYNPAGLEWVINKYAGGDSLKDVKVPVAVTTVDTATQEVILLSSEDEETKDVSILHAARATSAAPTYFPAQKVKLKNKELLCVDGGVGANNPTEEAYDHVQDFVKKSGKKYNIRFLSLGTGVEDKVKLDANAGKLGFGNPGNIPGYFMGATEAKIDAHMQKLAKKGKIEYNRANFKLPFAVDLADTSEHAKNLMLQLAWDMAHDKEDSLSAYITETNERLKRQEIAAKKKEMKEQKKLSKKMKAHTSSAA